MCELCVCAKAADQKRLRYNVVALLCRFPDLKKVQNVDCWNGLTRKLLPACRLKLQAHARL
jgi:hypothetical protein